METTQVIKGSTWQAKKFGNDYILNIDTGEKLLASIEDFVHHQNIGSGEVSGIGAANEATLAFYNFQEDKFDQKTFKEQMEITSALGNIAYKGDELYVHLHLTLGKSDYTSFAGHLIEATIHGVAEFYIRTNPFKLIKQKEEDGPMWVYDFDKTK